MARDDATEGISAWLGSLSDRQLEALVAGRRDLLSRPPGSLVDLGSRISATRSISMVLGDLDAAAVQVAAVLSHEGGRTSAAAVESVLRLSGPVPAGHVTAALERLAAVGIAWPVGRDTWRVAGGVKQLVPGLLGYHHTVQELAVTAPVEVLRRAADHLKLDPSGSIWQSVHEIGDLIGDPLVLAGILDEAPAGVTDLLEALTCSGAPAPSTEESRTWLIERCLAFPGPDGLVVPSEVVRHQRGNRVVGRVEVEPVLLDPGTSAADGQDVLMGLLAESRRLLCVLVDKAPKTLADGGIGVQEQRRLAKVLALPVPRVRWLLQLAGDAGIVASGAFAGRPTTTAATWLHRDDVTAALDLISPALSRRVLDEGDGPVLGHGWRGLSGGHRLRDFARSCAVPTTDASLVIWLRWRSYGVSATEVEAVLALLVDLGLRSGGWPSAWLLPLLDDDRDGAADALRTALPPEQDDVVFQADGTAFVAGRPTEELRSLLDLIGTRESDRTWRITTTGVLEAFDTGWTTDALLEQLERRSTHALPQALRVLVTDTGARWGRIRIVPSETLLLLDDEVLATELQHDRKLATLELTVVRPGVLTSSADPETVMARLREAGHAPVGPAPEAQPTVLARSPAPVRQHEGPSPRAVVQALRGQPVGSPVRGSVHAAQWVNEVVLNLTTRDRLRLMNAVAAGTPVEVDFEDRDGSIGTVVLNRIMRAGDVLLGWSDAGGQRVFPPDSLLAARSARFDPTR